MSGRATEAPGYLKYGLSSFLLAAFLSPGAWLIFNLPPVPVAQAFNLATAGACLIASAASVVMFAALDRRLAVGVVGIVFAVTASWLTAGDSFATAFYDLYANMPLVQWIAFLVMFILAAKVALARSRVEDALVAVVCFGVLLSLVLVFQQVTTATIRVFGSTGYSTAALMPLVPIAAVLAASRKDWRRSALYAAAAIICLALGVFSGSVMASLAAVFALTVTVAVHPASKLIGGLGGRIVRAAALFATAAMFVGLTAIQIPAVSSAVVDVESMVGSDRNILSRVQMWDGAQEMLADRPLLGFGPSGYRMYAAEYLPPEMFQHTPDRAGSIDPEVFSPQSPHSWLWEIGTRLGLAGFLAFAVMLGCWVWVLRDRVAADSADAHLRLALAGGFAIAMFALLVNPVIFAIGLFAPVMAGLAVAPWATADAGRSAGWFRPLTAVGGVVVIAVALWLGVGGFRLFMVSADDPNLATAELRGVLEIMPGHPVAERRSLEMALLLAADEVQVRAVQDRVDRAPQYIHEFAPNLVSLATYSLAQAGRTGRTDLTWEERMLDTAAERLPPTPALVAERLHLAVLSGDPGRVWEALPEAQRWGSYYPFFGDYLERAEVVVGQPLR